MKNIRVEIFTTVNKDDRFDDGPAVGRDDRGGIVLRDSPTLKMSTIDTVFFSYYDIGANDDD